MLLHPDPSLAEVPGFSREQLDALARSVELRRQQLESEIKDYIKRKQDALRNYEQELIVQYRSMECVENSGSAEKTSTNDAETAAASSASQEQFAPLLPDAREREPEEKTKRIKQTRVHKREKELYGLVTPVFLPLLDARSTSPTKKKEKKLPKADRAEDPTTAPDTAPTTSSRDAEKGKEGRKSRKEPSDMEGGKDTQQADPAKKAKRSPIKKSSLRHKDTPRTRRKRVSLVIDGQTVLPADTVVEPPLTSPSSECTSASNSTASLDDVIDPRLTGQDPIAQLDRCHAVHHSLPLPVSNNSPSFTKPFPETPTSLIIEAEHSPPLPSPRSPSIPVGPLQTPTRTIPDPPFTHPSSIPEAAGPAPIDPITSELDTDELAEEEEEEHWDTYVGGLHGSGVDDVDQAGSYGYPSSLGASYLESYMQSRPLSVRMQTADKAGLDERERREMLTAADKEGEEEEEEDEFGPGINIRAGKMRDVDDDMDIVGSMEDF